jgi:hypothetical protein
VLASQNDLASNAVQVDHCSVESVCQLSPYGCISRGCLVVSGEVRQARWVAGSVDNHKLRGDDDVVIADVKIDTDDDLKAQHASQPVFCLHIFKRSASCFGEHQKHYGLVLIGDGGGNFRRIGVYTYIGTIRTQGESVSHEYVGGGNGGTKRISTHENYDNIHDPQLAWCWNYIIMCSDECGI